MKDFKPGNSVHRFVATGAACLSLIIWTATYAGENWVTERVPQLGFSIQGPPPLRSSVDNSGGAPVHTVAFGNDFRAYTMSTLAVADPGEFAPDVLDMLQGSLLDTMSAALESERDTRFRDVYPARRITASHEEQGLRGRLHGLIVIANERAYMLIAAGNAGGRVEAEAERFFATLTFLR